LACADAKRIARALAEDELQEVPNEEEA